MKRSVRVTLADTVDAVVNSIKVNTNQFGTSATASQGI